MLKKLPSNSEKIKMMAQEKIQESKKNEKEYWTTLKNINQKVRK